LIIWNYQFFDVLHFRQVFLDVITSKLMRKNVDFRATNGHDLTSGDKLIWKEKCRICYVYPSRM